MKNKKTVSEFYANMGNDVRAFFVEQGRIGGKTGGKIAAANMTKKERHLRALKAVAAREAKKKLAS